MKSNHSLLNVVMIGLLLGMAGSQMAAADTLSVKFTPTYAGSGGYGDRYVMGVWLTTTSGTRICTLGGSSQGGDVAAGKVALWAYSRYASCYTWYTNNPSYRADDRTDRTGATQSGYREYTIVWDWKKYNTADPDGTIVPDGTYRLEFESSNDNGSANLNRQTVQITKGRTAWVLTPPDGDFAGIRIEYTPDNLALTNLPATNVTENSARIQGQITNTAGQNPTVYMYWGDNNAGSDAASWDHEVNLGTKGLGTYFADISGLNGNTTYYYTSRAVAGGQTVWASSVQSFTTLQPTNLEVSTLPAANVSSSSARIQGQITATAGQNPTVYMYWGDDNAGGTNPASWDHEVNLGTKGVGSFFADITGLTGNTTYYYTCRAVSGTQSVWALPMQSFTTLQPAFPDIQLNPEALTFDNVNMGQIQDKTVTIQNTGQGSLQVNSMQIVGLDAEQFSLVNAPTFPTVIPGMGSGTFTVRFSPSAAQQYGAQLALGSNDSDEPVLHADLAGSGGPEPEVALRQAGGIGGNAQTIAFYGSRILMGQGASLVLTDVSDPGEPKKAGQIRMQDVIESICVQGDIAYISLGTAGFAVVDLTDFAPLDEVAIFDTPGFVYDAACMSDRLYVADGSEGLRQYDLADPFNPQLLNVSMSDRLIRSVETSADTVYLVDEHAGVFKLSSPDVIAAVELGFSMTLAGTHLYCTDQLGGFFVLNASNLSAVGETVLSGGPGAAVGASQLYAYVAAAAGIEIVSLVDPAQPQTQAVIATAGSAESVLIRNNVLYLADGPAGLSCWNLADPVSPALSGQYAVVSSPSQVAANGSLSSVLTGEGSVVQTADVWSGLAPKQLAAADVAGHISDIAFSGDYAFLTKGLDGLQILNISQPGVINIEGVYPTESFASSVTATGTTALVGDGRQVYVLDVSAASNPVLEKILVCVGYVHDTAVTGDYVYAAAGENGIEIYNLLSGEPVKTVATGGPAFSVKVSEGNLYAACGAKGLEVYSLSSPTSPALISAYDTALTAMSLAVVGTRVCIAETEGAVSVVDISAPSQPKLYARTALPVMATAIESVDSRIIVADSRGGLALLAPVILNAGTKGDLNGDGVAGLGDLMILADHWMEAESGLDPQPVNLYYYDPIVNLNDLAELSSAWMPDSMPMELIGLWDFNETGGTVAADASPNGNDGTLVNGPVWTGDGTVRFDGIDDYIEVPFINAASEFSISAWIYIDQYGTDWPKIVVKPHSAFADPWEMFALDLSRYGRYPRFVLTDGNPAGQMAAVFDSSISLSLNRWYHIAATYDGQTATLYLDGQPVASQSASFQVGQNTMPVCIGGRLAENSFNGLLDRVEIYNRALTAVEIALAGEQ